MTPLQNAIAFIGLALVASALLGCVVRRRVRDWWFFAAYLLAVLVLGSLQRFERFQSQDFWRAKEIVYAALRFAMGCEVGLRTMRAFPGALATARRVVLLVLVVTLVAVIAAPKGPFTDFLGEVQPRVLNGSIWMMVAIAGVILWYRLPAAPFHKAVLLSYIPYIIIFTIVSRTLAEQRFEGGTILQYLNQLAYVAVVAYWNYAIWRRDPPLSRDRLPGAEDTLPGGRSGAA